jgi:predicted alpha/beta-hydrolase family hydrolase
MSSQAQAAEPLAGVHGLVFVGFPLHPPGNPSQERARHLEDVRIPMLFLQGTRDALAQMPLVEAVVERLGKRATLRRFEDADHSFHVPARAARDDAAVLAELCDAIRDWAAAIA